MPIPLTCACGREFEFLDDFAGQTITCPDCQREHVLGAAPARARLDPAFERDTFLISQKIRIDAKYSVTDEFGRPLLYVVRPAHLLRNLGAIFAGFAAAGAWLAALITAATAVGDTTTPGTLLMVIGMLGALPIFGVVAIALSKKRHTSIYRDERLGDALVTIEQDAKFQPIIATYTVRDDKGEVIARMRKNYLYNFIRKRWLVNGPDGREVCMCVEDSPLLALLRRFLGPLFGLLRTNFKFLAAESDDEIGKLDRKLTILDKYVLDLKADPKRRLDRRIALAVGVMLDTGERR